MRHTINPALSATALAHHWLVTYRGGERVLEQFRTIFPDAPVATLIHERGDIPDSIVGRHVITSPLQRLPSCIRKRYRILFPLHPWAFQRLAVPNSSKFVLSSDAAMVKALRMPADALHICYCHSPPRYLWDMSEDYARGMGMMSRELFSFAIRRARKCDYSAAQRVSVFVANSGFVAERIRRFYGRDSVVIYPPADVESFDCMQPRADYYLIVSQLVPYKRVDLAIEACNQLKRKLIVIGEGSEMARLLRIAGPTVRLLGRQPFAVVKGHMERCRAFIYPQVEDFGITAVEAQAAGAPVIALGKGGALETVVDRVTGLFFDDQSGAGLVDALIRFELNLAAFRPDAIRANAWKFRPERFRSEITTLLKQYGQ